MTECQMWAKENQMRERLLLIIDTVGSITGLEHETALLQELLDVADGLKARCEAGKNPDNTELMQRARTLLDA